MSRIDLCACSWTTATRPAGRRHGVIGRWLQRLPAPTLCPRGKWNNLPRSSILTSAEGDGEGGAGGAQPTGLSTDRKAYHQILTQETEFLISTNDAGELDFAEAFVKGRSDAEFQKCEVTGSYPGGMNAYQEIPWQVFHSADVMKGRPESFFETLKVVLVRVATKEPYRLDFERVVVVDGTTGSIDAPEVQWAGSKEETVDPVLRIIKDRFVIVDSSQKPDPERVVKGYFLNKRPEDVVQGMPEIDEVDAMNQGLDEPDVPTVDLV